MNRRHFLHVSMATRRQPRPRNERDISTDEFEVITARQAMRVLDRAEPDVVPRDWRLTIAAVCIGVSVVGLVLSAILAITWP